MLDLKKSWREEPHPIQRVRVGNSAEICAQVPEGLPEPEVSWSKDGKPMDLTNQVSSHDFCVFIKKFSVPSFYSNNFTLACAGMF